jgi:hypothetical protein
LSNWLEDIAKNIPTIVEKISFVVMEDLNVEMQNRIFNAGVDVNGVLFKNGEDYSERRIKERLQAGRQVNKIDLIFTGDLRKSITNTKSTEGQNIIFNSSVQSDKREEIEYLFHQQIFFPSDTESEKVLTSFENIFYDAIEQLAKRAKT